MACENEDYGQLLLRSNIHKIRFCLTVSKGNSDHSTVEFFKEDLVVFLQNSINIPLIVQSLGSKFE